MQSWSLHSWFRLSEQARVCISAMIRDLIVSTFPQSQKPMFLNLMSKKVLAVRVWFCTMFWSCCLNFAASCEARELLLWPAEGVASWRRETRGTSSSMAWLMWDHSSSFSHMLFLPRRHSAVWWLGVAHTVCQACTAEFHQVSIAWISRCCGKCNCYTSFSKIWKSWFPDAPKHVTDEN